MKNPLLADQQQPGSSSGIFIYVDECLLKSTSLAYSQHVKLEGPNDKANLKPARREMHKVAYTKTGGKPWQVGLKILKNMSA